MFRSSLDRFLNKEEIQISLVDKKYSCVNFLENFFYKIRFKGYFYQQYIS